MKNRIFHILLLFILCTGYIARGADFNSDFYTLNILNKNKAGFHIAIDARTFIAGHLIRAGIFTPEQKNFILQESTGAQYIYKDNTMRMLRRLTTPANILFAEVERNAIFTEKQLKVNIKITSSCKYRYSATWWVPFELMFIPIQNLEGVVIKGVEAGKLMEKLPVPKDSKRWGLKQFYPEIIIHCLNRKISVKGLSSTLVG